MVNTYSEIPFENSLISREKLDIQENRRTNSLPWRGQFSPKLVEVLLDEYATRDEVVLDPFCGSGTTLMEASVHGNRSYGIELNPAAYILARLYMFCGRPLAPVFSTLQKLESTLAFNQSIRASAESISKWIDKLPSDPEKIIMEAVFLLTLGNGEELKEEKLGKAFTRVRQLLQRLSQTKAESHLRLGDARKTLLKADSIDLILTSPPYVNVFNYHQNYRKAVELLGWEVLPIAKSEFGSNRKNRANRLRTVIQYAQDIGAALTETQRTVKNDGRSVWVVGRESKVRGCVIPNPEIIYSMATKGAGLTLETKMERSFISRYGQVVFEDILVFSHKNSSPTSTDLDDLGRKVGTGVLKNLVPEDETIASEIDDAIAFSQKISSSPLPAHLTPTR